VDTDVISTTIAEQCAITCYIVDCSCRWYNVLTDSKDSNGFVDCRTFAADEVDLSATVSGHDAVDNRHQQLVDYLRLGDKSGVEDALSVVSQLRTVQRHLLVRLADYWFVKYTVHLEARRRIGTTVDEHGLVGSWTTGNGVGGGDGGTDGTSNTDEAISRTGWVREPVLSALPFEDRLRCVRMSVEDADEIGRASCRERV